MPDKEKREVDLQDMREVLDVNVRGTILVTETLLPFIKPTGQIILVSSSRGLVENNLEDAHGYNLSKTLINAYAERLSRRTKVIVSAIHPGWIRTEMGGPNAPYTPEESAQWIREHEQRQKPSGKFWKLSD